MQVDIVQYITGFKIMELEDNYGRDMKLAIGYNEVFFQIDDEIRRIDKSLFKELFKEVL